MNGQPRVCDLLLRSESLFACPTNQLGVLRWRIALDRDGDFLVRLNQELKRRSN